MDFVARENRTLSIGIISVVNIMSRNKQYAVVADWIDSTDRRNCSVCVSYSASKFFPAGSTEHFKETGSDEKREMNNLAFPENQKTLT